MKPRWGLILTTANAAAATVFILYVWLTSWRPDASRTCPSCSPVGGALGGLGIAIVAVALVSAWIGMWAWSRARWSIAAPTILASVAVPWGYFGVIAGPFVLGLSAVATVRAYRARDGTRAIPRRDSDAG